MKYRWVALIFFLLVYLFPALWNAFSPEMDPALISRELFSLLSVGGTALVLGLFLLRFTRDPKIAGLGALLLLSFLPMILLATDQETPGMFFLTAALASFLPACMRREWDRVKVVQPIFCALCLWLPLHLEQCSDFFVGAGDLLLIAAAVMSLFLLWERRWRDFGLAAAVLLPSLIALLHNQELLCWRNPRTFPWTEVFALILCFLPGGLLLPVGLQGARGQWGEWLRLSHIRYLLCFLLAGIAGFLLSEGKLISFFPLAGLGAIALAAYFRQGGTQRFFRWVMAIWGCLCLGIAAICLLNFQNDWLWMIFFLLYGAALLISAIRYGWRDVLMVFFLGMIPFLILLQFEVQEDFCAGDRTECFHCPMPPEQE